AKDKITITWLGHAAFEVVSPGGARFLIDPFLKSNPSTPEAHKDLSKYKPSAILVSHSHFDHAADVMEIAKASGAPVVSTFDYVASLGLPDAQKVGGNVGGSFSFSDATVHIVPAMHSSDPGGRPVGFVIAFAGGRSVYHTGDTWIFSDMALIQEIYKPSVVLLNVGGGPFTQDPKTAALAAKKFLKPEAIIPMHFATFPPLAKEEDVRAAFGKDKRLMVLKPGESKQL
ncbi:MAG: metal-dependent hydrolase, partial [Deltaproteobacteria bacterium]|nr:metal-dependent hydrolase [Deltaproteobacteria bacterium]